MNRSAVEQSVHVVRFAAVAAEQSVLAEYPQVARLGDGLIRRRGDLVRITQTLLAIGIEPVVVITVIANRKHAAETPAPQEATAAPPKMKKMNRLTRYSKAMRL